MKKFHDCFISIGANKGAKQQSIERAVEALRTTNGVRLQRVSSLYETAPVGGPSEQQPYLNGVLKIKTVLSPPGLLSALKKIEKKVGRTKNVRWGAREIDLDLLTYNQTIRITKTLTIPHPRYHVRRFVLIPFSEIAAHCKHPLLQVSNKALLRELTPHGQRVTMKLKWTGKQYSPLKKKKKKEPIVAVTCYDAFSARLVDQGGVDIALVGDSLANSRLGYPNTLPITVDEMIHHVRAAARGVEKALLVADMPFQSYEADPVHAAKMAGRFVKEAGAQAVKVEGGRKIIDSVKAIIRASVPVMGHIGLIPQSMHLMGGYRVQGKSPASARELLKDAKMLQNAGVFAMVLEGIPASLGRKITQSVRVPTIGIGAGPKCDGQILVLDDLLGMSDGSNPKFVKKFANLRPLMTRAIRSYGKAVRSRKFPTKATSY